MNYNLILQWYYFQHTSVWPTYGMNKDVDKWCLEIDAQGNLGYEYWQGSFSAPDLMDSLIFNSENEALALIEEENQWQLSKSSMLKAIENLYISFLTVDWTIALRNAGIIPSDYTITVDNTDEITNIGMLMYLRNINKSDYSFCAGEFERFKTNILALGGIMSKVIYHEDLTSSSSSE